MKSNIYNELKDRREYKRDVRASVCLGVLVLSYFIGHLVVYWIK